MKQKNYGKLKKGEIKTIKKWGSQAHELHQGIRHASVLIKLRQSLSLVLKGL